MIDKHNWKFPEAEYHVWIPIKFHYNKPFHMNSIGFIGTQSFVSKGHIGKISISKTPSLRRFVRNK